MGRHYFHMKVASLLSHVALLSLWRGSTNNSNTKYWSRSIKLIKPDMLFHSSCFIIQILCFKSHGTKASVYDAILRRVSELLIDEGNAVHHLHNISKSALQRLQIALIISTCHISQNMSGCFCQETLINAQLRFILSYSLTFRNQSVEDILQIRVVMCMKNATWQMNEWPIFQSHLLREFPDCLSTSSTMWSDFTPCPPLV